MARIILLCEKESIIIDIVNSDIRMYCINISKHKYKHLFFQRIANTINMTTASSIQPDAVAASEKKMKSPCTRCFKNCSCIQQCPTRDVNYRY